MHRAFQEEAQVRLAPGLPDPGRGRESNEERQDRRQSGQLCQDVNDQSLARRDDPGEHQHHGSDEQHGPEHDGPHSASRDAARPIRGKVEGEGRVSPDPDEPRDEQDLDDLRPLGQHEPQRRDHEVDGQARGEQEAWRAPEVIDQPDHGVRCGAEDGENQGRCDRVTGGAEQPDHAAGDDRHGDRPEQEGRVEGRARRTAHGIDHHDREQAHEECLNGGAEQFQGGQGRARRRVRLADAARSVPASKRTVHVDTSPWRKQPMRWSFTRPADCMKA